MNINLSLFASRRNSRSREIESPRGSTCRLFWEDARTSRGRREEHTSAYCVTNDVNNSEMTTNCEGDEVSAKNLHRNYFTLHTLLFLHLLDLFSPPWPCTWRFRDELKKIAFSGVKHEQSRADRDSYVNVIYNNVDTARIHNYAKCRYSKYKGTRKP